jgi:hypothetical protein
VYYISQYTVCPKGYYAFESGVCSNENGVGVVNSDIAEDTITVKYSTTTTIKTRNI